MSEIKLKLWDNTERTFECGKPVVILGANGAVMLPKKSSAFQ